MLDGGMSWRSIHTGAERQSCGGKVEHNFKRRRIRTTDSTKSARNFPQSTLLHGCALKGKEIESSYGIPERKKAWAGSRLGACLLITVYVQIWTSAP